MEQFYKDLKISARAFGQLTSEREYVDLVGSVSGDLRTVEGRANLAQAITNRLLTRKGELSKLGHPNYGSRLYELTGELNNLRTRALAELYIRQSLSQERRIAEIVEVAFNLPSRVVGRTEMHVHIRVQPTGDEEELSISLPINL